MYTVRWTEENWYQVSIDAETEEEALEKFDKKEYDPTTGVSLEKIHIHSVEKID